MDEIIVKGKKYHAETGEALEVKERAVSSATNLHQKTQKSQTLNRKFVKNPAPKKVENGAKIVRKTTVRAEVVTRKRDEISKDRKTLNRSAPRVIQPISREVKKAEFKNIQQKTAEISRAENSAAVKTGAKISKKTEVAGEKYQPHPVQARAIARMNSRKGSEKVLPSMKEIKNNAIASALNQVSKEHFSEKKTLQKQRRIWFFAGGIVAVAVIAGAGILLNLRQISTDVASARGGFSASVPNYAPENYKLTSLPYFDGKSIAMKFSKDGGEYEIRQSESSWDSVALLENYVLTKWGKDYKIYREKGIIIYRNSKNSAVWVNGGRLFEIVDADELGEEEILKIAASF